MDLRQIAKAKQEIEVEMERVGKVWEELRNSLDALSKLEKAIVGSGVLAIPIVKTEISGDRARIVRPNERTVSSPGGATQSANQGESIETPSLRVDKALEQMSGKFTRIDLYNKAVSDGGGEIKSGTYAPIFAKLVKRDKIVLVEGTPGQQGSLYMKAGEVGLPAESPQAEQDEKLFF